MRESFVYLMTHWDVDSGESRLVDITRLILSVSAFVITFVDPWEPHRLVIATYTVLVLYMGFAVITFRRARLSDGTYRSSGGFHWIDCGAYTLLIALTGGTNSIFYTLYFFPITVASFRLGYVAGLRVIAVSLALYVGVGYWARPPAPEFYLSRFLMKALTLPTLGYMLAFWGGYELKIRRRLAFLRGMTTLSNPRFGVDRTFATNLERIREFFDAHSCVTVTRGTDSEGLLLRRAAAADSDGALRAESLPEILGSKLFSVEEEDGYLWRSLPDRRRPIRGRLPGRWKLTTGDPNAVRRKEVAEFLEASAFLSVPLRSGTRPLGRLYVVEGKTAFYADDADFLSHVVEHMMPVLENIRLVDQMASQAATEERQRIARDIHDRIIQPYIGLQMGVASLQQLFNKESNDTLVPRLKDSTSRLLELTESGVAELRDYIARLKYGTGTGDSLVESLRRFAARFEEATGIHIEVNVANEFAVNDRLAAEVMSMAAEGISNIRRHTQAERGVVELASKNDMLYLIIKNEWSPDAGAGEFMPRSITDRARALQGTVRVDRVDHVSFKETVIVVQIPL